MDLDEQDAADDGSPSPGEGTPGVPSRPLDDADFARLLAFRVALRRFDRWSEEESAQAGLTHAQHQLLLAVRGHADPRGPILGEVAEYLLVRHHSAVELVDRAARAGLVERRRDPDDQRLVRLVLTPRGGEAIATLTAEHLDRATGLAALLAGTVDPQSTPQPTHHDRTER